MKGDMWARMRLYGHAIFLFPGANLHHEAGIQTLESRVSPGVSQLSSRADFQVACT